MAWANAVSEGYFGTMGIPLQAGRDFDTGETSTSRRVAIVSSAMARKFFHGAAVGHQFQVQEGRKWSDPIEIVGVVGDTKYSSLRDSAQAIMYFPDAQQSLPNDRMELVVRTDGPPLAVAPAVRATLEHIDPHVSIEVRTLAQQLDQSMGLMRTVGTLSGFFGTLALLLAAIGVYGIMAYSVARRRTEIGVRLALGAAQTRVIRMVLGETGRMVLAGVVVGTALSVVATRLIRTFLYGLEPRDPATLAGSALTLLLIGLIAAGVPAIRAARLDPGAALREE
jgi:predicted permease